MMMTRRAWRDTPRESGDPTILAPASAPFSSDGGLKLLTGNLGRAVIKTSAVKPEHRVVQAPALVFETQEAVMAAFDRGELQREFVAIVRCQGPRANCMPELHKLTPILGTISMDLTTIDISHDPGLRPGDEVTLLGREGETSLDSQEIARVAGTISYNILCNIGARVRRVYV